jgi:hypothetical protein
MQPTDKFRTDLDQAARRAAGRGATAEIEALRSFFFRSFPKVGEETKSALFASYLERRRDFAGSAAGGAAERAAAWLAGVGSVLMMDYDGTPFSKADWEDIREAIVLEEQAIDIELLEYALSLVLDHGAL